MAISENGTKLAQLVNPQVLADMITVDYFLNVMLK